MVMDPFTAMAVGSAAGALVGFKVKKDGVKAEEYIVTPIKMPREQLQVTKPLFYKFLSLDMATARTNREFMESCDQMLIINRAASIACNIRINEVEYYALDLRDYKEFHGLIWRFFITNAAGTGTIDLLLLRGGAFTGTPLTAEESEAGGVAGLAFYETQSLKATHFIGAIVQNATEEANLTALVSNKIRITGVAIEADQQLDFRVIFFKTDAFADTDFDVDSFIDEVELDLPSYGFQIAGAGQYYMSVNGLEMDYEDEDGTSELHIALQNLSATAKTAGTAGEVVLKVTYEVRD